jgi:uncharacterized protein YlzI (FlbEa/FlbD family)
LGWNSENWKLTGNSFIVNVALVEMKMNPTTTMLSIGNNKSVHMERMRTNKKLVKIESLHYLAKNVPQQIPSYKLITKR